ncbi:MAG: putative membrane protein [Cyclobacteriaceae bacterium]|jgi:putative membrane protein
MYVKKRYSLWMTIKWSKWPFIIGALYGLIIASISYYSKINIALPWAPLGVIGIAVAFYLGFKNNSSYDRIWEARKIWGSIVNNSRTFGATVVSFVRGDNQQQVQKELIYRHIAWLTALRYQLSLRKEWEGIDNRSKMSYDPNVSEDYNNRLNKELAYLLSSDEIKQLKGKTNTATQILKIQSKRLQDLRDQNYFEDFRHMEFHKIISASYTEQGKSERIKNFPFPRQYSSGAIWFTIVFCTLVPFGLLDIMENQELWMIWKNPLFTGLITWVFFLMEKIGEYSENPFEGTYNDVPIESISRSIEIDIREMINDENIPNPLKDIDGFLM